MTYGKSENVKIRFRAIVHETEKAVRILFDFDGGHEEWLPFSQVEIDGNVVEMPEWLAIEKGLENYVD